MSGMPFTTYFIPFGIPILSIIVAIPLAMQKVPPNLWYGFRTRKTLSDRSIWYRANYLGGVNMLYAGIIALAINAALSVLRDPTLMMLIRSAIVAITMGIAMVYSMRQFRDL